MFRKRDSPMLLGCMLQEQRRTGVCGDSSCQHVISHNLNVCIQVFTNFPVARSHVHVWPYPLLLHSQPVEAYMVWSG